MKSQTLLIGSQTPTKLVTPKWELNRLDDFLAACDIGGLSAFEWQQNVLEAWLGTDTLGNWSAKTCGLSVPRQNGKTLGVSEVRMNGGLLLLNEQILYTAHLQKTATETFEDMATFFDSSKLKKYVKQIKTAIGREQIILKSGARIKFLARTRNGGRGQHGDLLVFDEAQELTDSQQSSFQFAISASKRPQTVYTGTPPDENTEGAVFRRIRERALAGETNTTAWAEWGVDEIGDVQDTARWYLTNPSLGILIQEETITNEVETNASDKFARERLGWWSDINQAYERVLDVSKWNRCYTEDTPSQGLMCVGVKFSPDGSSGALSVCMKPEVGKPHIEVVNVRSLSDGVRWFSEWIYKRKNKIASVAIDGKTGTAALYAKLQELGISKTMIVLPRTYEFIKAISMLINAVNAEEITHFAQPALDASATLTQKRIIGHDGVGFSSTADGDAILIESCALAYMQAMTTKRRPGRKAVIR